MPAWGKDVRLILTNRYSPSVASSLMQMGWFVFGPTKPSNASNAASDPLRELIAVNFDFDPLARIREYAALPAPDIGLEASGDEEDDEVLDDEVEETALSRRPQEEMSP
jgi:hypothetical protein